MEIFARIQEIGLRPSIFLLLVWINIFVIWSDLLNPDIAGFLPNCIRNSCAAGGQWFASAAFSLEHLSLALYIIFFLWLLLSWAMGPKTAFIFLAIIIVGLVTIRSIIVAPIYLYTIVTGSYVYIPLLAWTAFWFLVYVGYRIWKAQKIRSQDLPE